MSRRLFWPFLALALFTFAGAASATGVTSGTDQFGRNCDIVTWTDSTGNPRSVWIVNQTPGSFISKMTYTLGGSLVTATVPTTGFAFCTLVNHYYSTSTTSNDNYGGNYTSNNGASNPPSTQPGSSTYVQGAGVNRTIAFAGSHHLIWQASFQMYEHPWESADEWYITVQYAFFDGRDDFIFSNSYDSGAIPQLNTGGSIQQGSSNLAPYDDFSYDGVGNSQTDPQSGIGFGTNYKFATNYASGTTLSKSTGWTYNVANTIPYAWMYKDASLTDREMGEVQNQPYSEKDAGYNAYWAMAAPPSTGVTMPSTLPFQMNEFASYVGMRFTWGTQYTAFQNGHTDGQSAYAAGGPAGSWGVYPVNASSFNILIDKFTSSGVSQLVVDTENIYKSSLTATVGNVVTSGSKGPGNYLSSQTGTMPTFTYTHPGFDFVLRRWRVSCSGGNANVTLNAGGNGLNRPTFTFENLSSAPCTLTLNGTGQVAGTDYDGSFDSTNGIFYITFLKTLAAGANQIVVQTNCGPTATPTNTPTACLSCTATSTSSFTPTSTSTLTFTPTPPCSGGMLDSMQTNSTTNAWGGAWSSYAGTSPSTATFAMIAATPGNGYTAPYCANMYGTANSAGYPSLSTFLNSSNTGVNVSQYSGVQFWFKGDGGTYQFQMHSTVEGSNYNDQYYDFTSTTSWTLMNIPFSSLQVPSWGPTYSASQALTTISYITWVPITAGSYNFSVGTLQFTCPSAPTATFTPTVSATATYTATPTNTPNASWSPTPTFTVTPTPAPSGGLIQPNMKICFIGDSITYRGNYVKQVENYLNTIYPNYNLTYVNVGVGGWTANQFLNYTGSEPTGLSYVLNTVKPDIATICFGMNDAGYTQESTSMLTTYQNSMTSIITQLKNVGIKVVLLTPGAVDQTVPWASNTSNIPADYNTNTTYGLAAYANWVMSYGATNNIPAFNVHDLAMTVAAAGRAAHPGPPYYTDQPQDGIHPNPSGGLVYAYGLLKDFGVATQNRNITLSGGTLTGSTGAMVGPWQLNGNGGSFTLTADPMPYIHSPQTKKVLSFFNFQQTFNNINFTASGLTAANYYVIIDGYQAGPVASSALASGINLCDYWINPPTSPTQTHTVQLVDASTLSPACYNTLIDDMQKSNDFPQIAPLGGNVPWPENLWGGWWYAGNSSGSGGATLSTPVPFVMTSPGYNGLTYAANLSGTTNLSAPASTQILLNYCYTQYDDPKNGVQFMFKGTSGQPFRLQVHTEAQDLMNPVNYADYGYTFTANGSWQSVTVLYSAMAQPSWAGSATFILDPGQITTLEWIPYFSGSYSMSVANLNFWCANQSGTATPTNTTQASSPTATPSSTPSKTATSTVTATATSTATLTTTASATATPSSSPTVTASMTASNTPNSTSTASSTPSNTATASSSMTATPSLTGTWTASNTATSTATSTASSTATGTPTSTFTSTSSFTPTATFTRTFTFTSTSTFSPTITATPTSTLPPGTNTPTPAYTNTFTATYSPTLSYTPTFTYTNTFTWTATPTATASTTATPTSSPTLTASSTTSATPSNTFTASATGTPSRTPTSTSTASWTPSGTPSSTSTASWTPSSTATATSTFTSTTTATASKTSTASATPSATPFLTWTATHSPTATYSNTPTPTPTWTWTASFTSTSTASMTPSATATQSWTPTASTSATPTSSPTLTAGFTATSTATASATGTASLTKTPTLTPTPATVVVIYPNPYTGNGPVQVRVSLTGLSDVEITVYTIAFRTIQDLHFEKVPPGVDLSINMLDRWGTPLANGLYYVRVKASQGQSGIGKLLVIR